MKWWGVIQSLCVTRLYLKKTHFLRCRNIYGSISYIVGSFIKIRDEYLNYIVMKLHSIAYLFYAKEPKTSKVMNDYLVLIDCK